MWQKTALFVNSGSSASNSPSDPNIWITKCWSSSEIRRRAFYHLNQTIWYLCSPSSSANKGALSRFDWVFESVRERSRAANIVEMTSRTRFVLRRVRLILMLRSPLSIGEAQENKIKLKAINLKRGFSSSTEKASLKKGKTITWQC